MLQETHMLVDFLKAASGQNLSLDGLSEEIDAMILYHVHIMVYLFHSYFMLFYSYFCEFLFVSICFC